ncbi:hypothetical protein LEMLEM_LOCUS16254, partial [Lemmus lemmus]
APSVSVGQKTGRGYKLKWLLCHRRSGRSAFCPLGGSGSTCYRSPSTIVRCSIVSQEDANTGFAGCHEKLT